jgi:cephalosporin-C deacetylase-like acetyl esterase
MVSLALNIRGHGNSMDHIAPEKRQNILYHLDDPETYFYRGAYMDCIRALDFLYSREEVDTTLVAVEGGSQGGALSLATAALDPDRIALCVPHVPFLSDFRDYFRIVAWPGGEVFQFMEAHPEIPEDEIYRTLAYIDVKNLAPWVKAPVVMAVGLKDRTCPPHINFAVYNQLKVPRRYIVYPESGHSLPGPYYTLVYDIVKEAFFSGGSMP